MIDRGRCIKVDKMGKGGPKVQTFHCKTRKHWDVIYSMVTLVNNTVCVFESCSESRS